MATATATYSITLTSGLNTNLFNGDVITGTLARTSNTAPPANAYVVSGLEQIANFYCYNGTSNTYNVGYSGGSDTYYGRGGAIDSGSGEQSLYQDSCTPNDAILQVGTSGVSVTIKIVGNTSSRIFRFSSSTTITWTVTYDVMPSASTATYTSPVETGSNMTINISNSDGTSNLTHRINFAIGSYTDTVNLGLGVTQTTYTVPAAWANAITNSDTGICAMTLSTYMAGEQIGSRSYSVTIQVATGSPTIGSVTAARINNSVPSSWGVYVQGKSGVTITANNCQGSNGSSIVKYVISGGMSATQSTNSFTLNPIQTSGNVTFTITITDSRGRTASSSVTIYVYAYAVPSITSTSAFKSNSSGTASTSGRYLAIKMSATYSSVNSKNSISLKGYYRVMGASSWSAATTLTNNTTAIVGGGLLDPEQNYEVKFEATDALSTVTQIVDVNSTMLTLHFKNGGNGMGIGMTNTTSNTLKIADTWTIYHGSYVMPTIVVSATQPATPATGLIWLQPVT